MDKINFVNGQAPALNATNLNQMQDNIENAINTMQDNIENEIMEKVVQIGSLNQISPLTISNRQLIDTNIINAKLVIVYYTFAVNSTAPYRNSAIIPNPDREWFSFMNGSLYGYVNVNWTTGRIGVSELSHEDFGVVGYTIVK